MPSPGAVCPAMVRLSLEFRVQGNGAGHVEDDRAVRLAHRVAERPRTAVVEVRHVVDLAAAAARRVHAATLGSREGAHHTVVLVGKRKAEHRTVARLRVVRFVGIGFRALTREGDELREGRILPLVGPDGRCRPHTHPVAFALGQFEIMRRVTRRGRLCRRRRLAAVEFVGIAHVGDLLGEAPLHVGRQLLHRYAHRRDRQYAGPAIERLLGGVAAAGSHAEQDTQSQIGKETIHSSIIGFVLRFIG